MIRFPQEPWGVRINLTATLSGGQVYQADPLLALLPAGISWAHWTPRVLGHTTNGWMPVASMFGGVHPREAMTDVPTGSLFLIGNDMEGLAILRGQDTVQAAVARHVAQIEAIRSWAVETGNEWAWAAPQWNINEQNLDLLDEWIHVMRQHYGYPRPHRLAIHAYGSWSGASFLGMMNRFDAWLADQQPDTPVMITEFSGWPGSRLDKQMEVMYAGRQYLERSPNVQWAAWFSGYRFSNDYGESWGTELARVDESGGVALTELGEYFVSLQHITTDAALLRSMNPAGSPDE